MRKLLRELRREFPNARITTTRGNHYQVVLSNGRTVIVSNSPSCRNFLRQAIAEARRQSRNVTLKPGETR